MKNTFYVVLILIIIGLSYLKWQAKDEYSATPSPSPSPIASSAPATLDSEVLETPYFKLEYPVEASSSAQNEGPDSKGWRIYFMGDTQKNSGRTQTELFDGYIVVISAFPDVIGDDPALTQAQADRQGIIDGCGVENVTKIESAKLGQYDTLSYYGGCLGESNQYYTMQGSTLFRITEMVVGPESVIPTYKKSTKFIFDSLKFSEDL